ncbi:hypothetical protein O3P69_010539 [Scylla paramamosain]|uniref:Uncharacterized protein n=1 Tax=Scylla paramamosain TaxID=85552 RepID=A0AAW0SF07_SCYPA
MATCVSSKQELQIYNSTTRHDVAGRGGAPFPRPPTPAPAANQSLCFVFRSRWLLRTPVREEPRPGWPITWRRASLLTLLGSLCLPGEVEYEYLAKVRAALSLEKGCVGAEQEEERAREQRSNGAKPGDAGLSGDRSRNERVFEQRERRKILETEGDAPPVNNNGVICFQEENTFDTDRCGYCEALLAFTLHPLRPPVITSPFQRRHYCDGYAAFEGSSSRPSLGRTRLTLKRMCSYTPPIPCTVEEACTPLPSPHSTEALQRGGGLQAPCLLHTARDHGVY